MRTPLVAGNWKMNKTAAEARELVSVMRDRLREIPNVEKVLCPPFLAIPVLAEKLEDSGIGLGAQNLHWEEKGAFTGELAANMVKEFCQYVIIGHSERRTYFGETDESVNRKLQAAIKAGLTPIVCVGETLEQYEAGSTSDVVRRQIRVGLAGFETASAAKLVVAYEPVWAIGTGLAADGATAQDAIALIRSTVREVVGAVAADIRILYGGSVTPDNVAEFMGQPDIDGGLVGGASLKADSFAAMVEATAALYAKA
jgi:triosephosphate isomerase